ncbi:MAG TPA: hypothetical protein VHZ03_49810 [Trebonia sp.]|nr:hypothetical protein [Trebonia sp.]
MIDEAIRAILSDAAGSSESSGHGKAPATTILETAALVSTMANSRMSTLERFLLTEAIGSAMADALAPALAEQLIPRLLKFQEDGMAVQSGKGQGQGQGRAGSTNGSAGTTGPSRKSDK